MQTHSRVDASGETVLPASPITHHTPNLALLRSQPIPDNYLSTNGKVFVLIKAKAVINGLSQ